MQGVYFKNIHIDNAFCFAKDQQLSFENREGSWAKWNVILGDNGTGKTTLLKLLASLEMHEMQNADNTKCWVPQTGVFPPPSNWEEEEEEDCNVRVDLFMQGDKYVKPIELGIKDFFPFKFSIQNQVEYGLLQCFGYGATRVMGNTLLAETESAGNSASLFYEYISLINAEEWLLQLDYSANITSDIQVFVKKQREQVKAILIDLLPGVEDIQFAKPTMESKIPKVEFKTFLGWVNMQNLSLGYKTMVAWIVDFAYRMYKRYPNVENPLTEPAIVLVDEIDLHLHPKWQRQIFTHLNKVFPATQFIVTAHSPLIVQSIPGDANLILLKQEGNKVTIDQNLESVKYWRIDQILSSELFDLPVRSDEVEEKLERRRTLTAKPAKTLQEEQELRDLQAFANQLPYAESKVDSDARELIRRTSEFLKQHKDFSNL